MNNGTYAGEVAGNISAKKKAEIVRRAQELGVRILNVKGKLRAEEKKGENRWKL